MADRNVFHSGEAAAQARADVPADWMAQAARMIRPAMPDQHRTFFESLPLIFLGALDGQGRVWASAAFGEAGFIASPDRRHLVVRARPVLTEKLDLQLAPGAKIGAVGMELHTRRRNRVNGTLGAGDESDLTISVDQSFGNCPQYIQAREFDWANARPAARAVRLEALDTRARALIARADTFIIASRAGQISDDPRDGVDASHRGGRPGFLDAASDGTLSFPDFAGNRIFNTLGNIESDGRVGLFVPDFESGAAVFLTGRARVDWSGPRVAAFPGAQRIIDVVPEEIWYVEDAIPGRGLLRDVSPALAPTGIWADAQARSLKIDGHRPLAIAAKTRESETITSFTLAPADGGPVEPHVAGQFLPIRMRRDGDVIQRSYTISQAPNGRDLRLSVKREAMGESSRHLHDVLGVGDRIEAASPGGDFVLEDSDQPVVMLSAGVGITPMIAMLEGQIAAMQAGARPRDVWFVHATQNSRNMAFRKDLEALAEAHPWLRLHIAYSAPEGQDVLGRTHHAEGRIGIATLRGLLPFGAYHFYLCGPEGFMRDLYTGLREIGIDRSHIHYEFFGSGSLEEDAPRLDLPDRAEVSFDAAEQSAEWTPTSGTLLELAEEAGLTPPHSCRQGNCGSCATRLLAGEVQYTKKPGVTPREGHVLTCCSVPAGDAVKLDL
ncbi:MAG: 2Fe-2S iron-sulfur cluster-binding protein [Pseudomonadota bacterium]